jgi:ParB family chromosome partitioning protein
MENKGIIFIPAEQIYQHPDNPRKDLGDLQELSDSIRKKGIMQNLTVMKGHYITDEEWKETGEAYKENPTEELKNKMNSIHTKEMLEDGYTLLIGHRRFAAGKLAGLTEFPCRIVTDIDRKDQVGTMLEENMQRNDLTIWEQANGFQMMLDLGETEEQISEKTGFSKTTIRHRLNIAKLDQKTMQRIDKDESFQLSLKDLYELEKIADVKTRDEVLKNATDSRDLARRALRAVAEQNRKKNEKLYIEKLKKLGVKKAPEEAKNQYYSGKWDRMQEFNLDKEPPKNIKVDTSGEQVYYLVLYSRLSLIRKAKKEKKELTPEEQVKKQHERDKKHLKAVMKEAANNRRIFIEGIISGKIKPIKDTKEIEEDLFEQLMSWEEFVGHNKLKEFFTGCPMYNAEQKDREEAEKKSEGLSLVQKLLCLNSAIIADKEMMEWNYKYKKITGAQVMKFYAVLEKYGFQFATDEERRAVDGTSELYVK